jgi:hypothetical protein
MTVISIFHPVGTFSDVVIHITKEELPAHKCILCTQSIVFSNIVSLFPNFHQISSTESPPLSKKKSSYEIQTGGDFESPEESKTQEEE